MKGEEKKLLKKYAKPTYLDAVFPYLKEKKTQNFLTLSLTLLAIAVFGLFAINPTIGTIIELRRQLDDAKYADAQLTQKIANLSALGQKYIDLQNDLPLITDALPMTPQATLFVGEVNALAEENNVSITIIHTTPFSLLDIKQKDTSTLDSFTFSVDADGQMSNLLAFAGALSNSQRVTTITSLVVRDPNGTSPHMTFTGKAYSKK